LTRFIDGSGLVVPGKVFPFCFITIACGSISGFHALIASGTTPKIIARERHSRTVGYGAMCVESFVAIMAIIAACSLEPGVYLSMNVKGAGPDAAAMEADTLAKVHGSGLAPVTETSAMLADKMHRLANTVQEKTLFARTGGAATLAVGMAQIFAKVTQGRGLGLWYHFAIMFEALFILTTLDAGTRVGRYLLQDLLGSAWKPLGDTKKWGPNVMASSLIVGAWGYFLIQGVRDPLGGINSLWPLFGIANQLLAAIALCLGTTIILKMQLTGNPVAKEPGAASATVSRGHLGFALVTLIPLIWLLAVTMTAGWQKILHEDPKIGFLAAARGLDAKLPALTQALDAARTSGDSATIAAATKALRDNRVMHFNSLLDACVAGFFLLMVAIITLLAVWEWILLLMRRRSAALREAEPVWLPEYAVTEPKPLGAMGVVVVGLTLARELSGEAQMERAQQLAAVCHCVPDRIDLLGQRKPGCAKTPGQIYLETTEKRFDGINRCC
jgi:carbon starvation protein